MQILYDKSHHSALPIYIVCTIYTIHLNTVFFYIATLSFHDHAALKNKIEFKVGLVPLKAFDKSGNMVVNVMTYYNVSKYMINPGHPAARFRIRAIVSMFGENAIKQQSLDGPADPDRLVQHFATKPNRNTNYSLSRTAIEEIADEWTVASLNPMPTPYLVQHVYPMSSSTHVLDDCHPYAACRIDQYDFDKITFYIRIFVNPTNDLDAPDGCNGWIWNPEEAAAPDSAANNIPYDRTQVLWEYDTMNARNGNTYSYSKARLSNKYIKQTYSPSSYANDFLLERFLNVSRVTLDLYGAGREPVGMWKYPVNTSNATSITSFIKPYGNIPLRDAKNHENSEAKNDQSDDVKTDAPPCDDAFTQEIQEDDDMPMPHVHESPKIFKTPPYAIKTRTASLISKPSSSASTNAENPYVLRINRRQAFDKHSV